MQKPPDGMMNCFVGVSPLVIDVTLHLCRHYAVTLSPDTARVLSGCQECAAIG